VPEGRRKVFRGRRREKNFQQDESSFA